jgi:photosystem II stability/assembly factor-like uncharacterized protein
MPGGGGVIVHTIVVDPSDSNRLYACVSAGGAYRSDDAGDTWVDISEGLPSRFGFPMAVHPHDPGTIYVVPLTADSERFVPEGRMAVWRSQNEGRSWEPLTRGLPDHAWLTILRESLAVDARDPAGIYVGTTTGQVFYSRDAGEHWQVLADYLPPVLAVSAATVVA